ncbi:MAG: hypothetical protein ABGY42_03915 [bacterium]
MELRSFAASAALMAAACSLQTPTMGSEGAPPRLAGVVLAVAPLRRRLEIIDAGQHHTIEVQPDAVIRRGRENIKLDQLSDGDRIVIVATEPGTGNKATWIAVSGAALRLPDSAESVTRP